MAYRRREPGRYSSADAYKFYMDHLLQKIIALPPIDLTRGSDNQKHADTAATAATSQVPTSGVAKNDKTDSGGDGGLTVSGLAKGGDGAGGGGSAVSGSTGNAYGGDVGNQAAVIVNGYKASECLYIPIFFVVLTPQL